MVSNTHTHTHIYIYIAPLGCTRRTPRFHLAFTGLDGAPPGAQQGGTTLDGAAHAAHAALAAQHAPDVVRPPGPPGIACNVTASPVVAAPLGPLGAANDGRADLLHQHAAAFLIGLAPR